MEPKELVESILDAVKCAVAAERFMMKLDKIQREEAEGIRPMRSEESEVYQRMIHNLRKHRKET